MNRNHNSLQAVDSNLEALILLSEGTHTLGLDSSTISKRAAGTAELTILHLELFA